MFAAFKESVTESGKNFQKLTLLRVVGPSSRAESSSSQAETWKHLLREVEVLQRHSLLPPQICLP